jgi:glycosyltransferase involved in cell wall biosynthesis
VHQGLPAISVVVPNYNYAEHMPKRLSSIFLQTQPVKEILVLDDCSTDDSLTVIPAVAKEWGRHIRLLPNRTNSGSVFKQWRKAADTASGEFLWIAEADDLCAPQFLAEVVPLMRNDRSVKFTFSDSSAIDAKGAPMWSSYKSYYASVAPNALSRTAVFEGEDFARRFLSVKNLILNVSAVLWRREALLEAMNSCEADLRTYKMAGDWRLYLQALSGVGARVGYCAEPLNTHRRHGQSVTHALNPDKHIAEIATCHAFADSAFKLSPESKRAQRTYLREVRQQLGAISNGKRSAQTTAKYGTELFSKHPKRRK